MFPNLQRERIMKKDIKEKNEIKTKYQNCRTEERKKKNRPNNKIYEQKKKERKKKADERDNDKIEIKAEYQHY